MAPWSRFSPAIFETCEPNVDGWIVHPAETLSAFGYFVAAIFLWKRFGRADKALMTRHLPTSLLVIGFASVLFHASYTAVFQAIDIAAISLFIGYILAATFVHRRQVDIQLLPYLFLGLVGTGLLLPLIQLSVALIFVVLQGCIVIYLWCGRWVEDGREDARLAVTLLIPGAVLLLLDHAAIGCVTGQNAHIIQPHVAWHLLSAGSAVYFYRAERLFEQRWTPSCVSKPPAPPPSDR